jgi:[pyruvate, water dikinase]-phosphate phosphotransferase / [pyruvate, water dikinase] kinase
MTAFHLHLVSDATGETINAVARACLVQFESAQPIEHVWSMIRSERQLAKVLSGIGANPGVVLFTLVNEKLRRELETGCRTMSVPCIPVLDPVLKALEGFLNAESRNLPGRQHALDAEYFARIAAMDFVMAHDDGQSQHSLNDADVVLVGVSRTSKTPTCIYLGNRGVKAANVPLIPGQPWPDMLDKLKRPLVVGLTNDPTTLVQIRRNRLRMLNQNRETDYTEMDAVKQEVAWARRMFSERGWPIMDTSRRSIEETAAAILQLVAERRGQPASP